MNDMICSKTICVCRVNVESCSLFSEVVLRFDKKKQVDPYNGAPYKTYVSVVSKLLGMLVIHLKNPP